METWIPQAYEVMADPARAAGQVTGQLLVVSLLIALVVFVIARIGRRRRKKRNQQDNANPYGPQR
jgi:hypothetical protein